MLTVVNGILGALVGVTGGCAVFNVYSSLIVGAVGSFVANITPPLLDYWKVGNIESRDSNKGPHEHLLSFVWKYRGKVAVYQQHVRARAGR